MPGQYQQDGESSLLWDVSGESSKIRGSVLKDGGSMQSDVRNAEGFLSSVLLASASLAERTLAATGAGTANYKAGS